ncbi:AAA family ATPase [Deinococcus navajonensis]|uniref:AAA family ATPase n=1 Tax=Deinococcus navajonensis TaxID=309884 RepID=A0ABV8XNL5_9DEIO
MLQTLNGLRYGGFRRVKPLLILAFVALEGPTPRRRLAELLWPGAQQPDSSLRVALHALRDLEPSVLDRQEPLATALSCDAAHLLGCTGLDALNAYPGPFLYGVALQGVSAEFEEWVLGLRERLAHHVQTETLAHAERLDPAPAAALAERVLRLPGAAPPGPELLRQLLSLSLPGSALETQLRGDLDSYGPADLARDTRPSRHLLGRATELNQLVAWACAAGGGAAVISGPGGIGKSVLGREVLRELNGLGQPVIYVDASAFRTGSEALAHLADLLGRTPPDAAPARGWNALARRPGDDAVVLLDGLDSLEAPADLLTDLRRNLPRIRWLLTVRRPLRPGQLWRRPPAQDLQVRTQATGDPLTLHLSGLDCPAPEAVPGEILASPAAQLFLREASRAGRSLPAAPDTAVLVAGVTRRLQGHPLALMLAAAWLRSEDLASVHRRTVEADRRPGPDHAGAGPPEPGSLDAVAAQAWARLSPEEQRALLTLEVFADFDPQDADAVGVGEQLLDSLLGHAFLERSYPGHERLRLSPALRRAVRAHSAGQPEQRRAAADNHARHYLTWFAAQPPASPAVAEKLDNLLLATGTALERGTLTPAVLYGLMGHYDAQGQHDRGAEALTRLAELAEDHGAPDDVQAAAQIACMWLLQRADRLLDAQTLATRFLGSPLARDPGHRMRVLNTLATVRKKQSQMGEAAQLTRQALAVARQVNDQTRAAMYLTNLLGHLVHLGEFAEVRALLPELEAVLVHGPATSIRATLAWVQLSLPDPPYAQVLAQVAPLLDTARAAHDLLSGTQLLLYCGMAHLGLDQPRQTLGCVQQLLAMRPDDVELATNARFLESRALYALGRTPDARRSARRGLQAARAQQSLPNIVEGLMTVSRDLLQRYPEPVHAQLTAVYGDRRTSAGHREQAKALLGREPAQSEAFDPQACAEQVLRWLEGR